MAEAATQNWQFGGDYDFWERVIPFLPLDDMLWAAVIRDTYCAGGDEYFTNIDAQETERRTSYQDALLKAGI